MLSRHTHAISLHYFDVHSPYRSQHVFERAFLPPDFRRTSKITGSTLELGLAGANDGHIVLSEREREELEKLYDAGILQLDSDLGRLFRFIDERFGFDDTLVIVTSDHGEGFFEHGRFSHGEDQYQEQLHVPLILRGGRVPASVRVDEPTSIVDIAPTILAAAGVAPRMPVPGVDLGDYWAAPALARDERVLYSQSAPGPEEDVIRMAQMKTNQTPWSSILRRSRGCGSSGTSNRMRALLGAVMTSSCPPGHHSFIQYTPVQSIFFNSAVIPWRLRKSSVAALHGGKMP